MGLSASDNSSTDPISVLMDPPPPYGGVRVSAVETFQYLKKIGVRDYVSVPFDSGGAVNLANVRGYLNAIGSSRIVVFQIGDIFTLMRKRGVLYWFLAWIQGKRLVYRGFAGGLSREFEERGVVFRWLYGLIANSFSIMTFQTREDYEYFRSKVKNTCALKWYPNTRMSLGGEIGKKTFSGRFCFVGKVWEPKGIDIIIEAGRQLPDEMSIDIFGPLDPAASRRLGLDERGKAGIVKYRGKLEPEKVRETIAEYDALLFPTRWKTEGHPGVVMEALSVGVPVIASRWNGIPEIVDESCGILIEPVCAEQLASSVMDLKNSPWMWNKMRQNAVVRMKQFDPTEWAKRFDEWVGTLVEE